MKRGDLVKFKSSSSLSPVYIGLVIETGVYVGNTDVKVCWGGRPTAVYTEYSRTLEVISETR